VLQLLKEKDVLKQTPATGVLDNTYFNLRDFTHASSAPPTTGFSRLIDGTVIHVAGTINIGGDTMQVNFKANGFDAFIDAVGIAAVRLDKKGNLEALAGGGLKSFKTGSFEINLKERADVVLWKDAKGKWQGVLQGWDGDIPAGLAQITTNWSRLNIPIPPQFNFGRFRN
jgi:hypothetical protein